MGDRPRIALVAPRTPLLARRPRLVRLWRENAALRDSSFFFVLPSLALLTLAGRTPPDFELFYLDENVERIGLPDCEIAAITSMTCQAPRAYRLAALFRRRGSHVVLGGMHPSVLPEEALGHADTVIAGEGEGLWERFLADYSRGKPQRLYRAPPGVHPDLDLAPVPRYDLAGKGKYRAMPLQIGRGCPLGCEFCSVECLHGRRYRHKRLSQVVKEILAIRNLSSAGRPRIFFTDDNLHLHRDFFLRLLEEITPLRVNWMAQMDISVARDPGLLRRMARSGCSQLLVGFESLDAENLHALQPGGVKPRLAAEYGHLAGIIQSHGIRVLGMFIVGLDHDRPGVFHRLADFITRHHLHDAQVTIQTPLPGTRLFARLLREGRLTEPLDWGKCNFFHVLYRPLHLTPRQLAQGQSWIYGEIHRPENAARRRRWWLELFRQRAAGPRAKG